MSASFRDFNAANSEIANGCSSCMSVVQMLVNKVGCIFGVLAVNAAM